MSWNEALRTFCELYSAANLNCNWIVVGSVGSVLQGAEMTPNDLDIYVKDIDDVIQIAALLEPYSMGTKSELSYFDADWLSSINEPYFTQSFDSGFTWTKGKWKIQDFSIEVVHISDSAGIPDSVTGEGIWEGGQYIWTHAKTIDFEKYVIPVVPLEIQLESNMRRNSKTESTPF
ncbi:nucleotidyltransferase family protein [Cohnella cholangitidis]|uniref:Aminoglycoside adenylyltransferase n=1 Tax=Cohnella cholangitidis TaxID=2598458 RepID=A0A7G5BSU8_9BACL|nr:hypothetical protein [Cohnella cholangitidis]QMV40032.1 hypothetical protein FPL14_01560 [Cohnella cholangitidis]